MTQEKKRKLIRIFCYGAYFAILLTIVSFIILTVALAIYVHPYNWTLMFFHIIIDPAAYVFACQFLHMANCFEDLEENCGETE